MHPEIVKKQENLRNYLRSLGSAAVAFSGGVDSTLLLFIAHQELGENAIAVTARSPFFPEREFREAQQFAEEYGIRQIVVELDENQIPGFIANPPDRCYLCKKELIGKLQQTAKEQQLSCVVEGSNLDDLGDYRPGLQAVEEMGVQSPLRTAGLYKEEIRELSREWGLPTWEKPSCACLASRFPYGQAITRESLSMVEKAEQSLLNHGFRQVRVRHHGALARIEVEEGELERFLQPELRKTVYHNLKDLGYLYITLDCKGYRTGSMNETLPNRKEDCTR